MGRTVRPRKAKEPEPPAQEERGCDATDPPIPRKVKAGQSSTAKAPPQADPDKFRTRTKLLDEVWSNERRGRCLVEAALDEDERTKERVRTRTNKQEVVVSCCRLG
jgi:hypothetical protein